MSGDMNTVAAGFSDGAARVYALEAGEVTAGLRGSRRAVTSLAFRADGDVLISPWSTAAALWGLPSPRGICTIDGLPAPASHLCSKDGETVIAGCADGALSALPVRSQAVVAVAAAHTRWYEALHCTRALFIRVAMKKSRAGKWVARPYNVLVR